MGHPARALEQTAASQPRACAGERVSKSALFRFVSGCGRLSDNEHSHGRIGQSFPADDGNPSREALCFQSLPEAPLWHGKCTIGV